MLIHDHLPSIIHGHPPSIIRHHCHRHRHHHHHHHRHHNHYSIHDHPGGLFIEPAFSTFAVFVIDSIPQITVVLHLSQSSISLKSTRVLFTGYVKNLSGTLFFLR